jgi:alpha-methylacyl-CoA racemase
VSSLPLQNIRVLDFTRHLPGPYASDLLRRMGAEVIKIEPPEGDPTRWIPPFSGGDGALYTLVNAGKKSVAVNLKTAEGRELVHRLAEQCDVAMESYRPGVAAGFGVDGPTLRSINPRLVHCSISGFGAGSARSSHDLNFVALAGLLDLQRDQAGRPILPATQIGDMAGALFAALAIVAALFERERSGSGRQLDISMSDATRAVMPTAESLYRGLHQTPATFILTGSLPSYNLYATSDGEYLAVAALEPRFWSAFCKAIGHAELIERQLDESATEEIRRTIERTISSKSRAEWEKIFETVDACVEPVLSIEEAHHRFGDPLLRHPIQTNFPSTTLPVSPLGSDFAEVAALAGFDRAGAARLKRSGSFTPKGTLKKFLFRANRMLSSR